MPTIELQGLSPKKGTPGRDVKPSTASVGASPGRLYTATLDGIPRTFERVGVNAAGQEIYRDQTRY